jgi:hypothetical protein
MKKPIIYGTFILGLLCANAAYAAPPPPWLAVAETHSLSLSGSECVSAARAAFKNQGFARVSTVGTSVMAAYQGGQDYQFKAVIKCMPSVSTAVAVVVTTVSGAGTEKANQLINGLLQAGSGGGAANTEADEGTVPVDEVFTEDEDFLDDDFVDDYADDAQ